MKKQSKTTIPSKKISDKEPTGGQIEELIKSEIYLYQFCNTINQKVADLELKLQNAYSKIAILEKNDDNLRKILEVIGEKLKFLKDQMSDGEDDMDDIRDEEDGDEDMADQLKNPPMHDDITIGCEVCNKIFHARLKKCPNCGFNRFEEKDR
jgi:rubrerythrin